MVEIAIKKIGFNLLCIIEIKHMKVNCPENAKLKPKYIAKGFGNSIMETIEISKAFLTFEGSEKFIAASIQLHLQYTSKITVKSGKNNIFLNLYLMNPLNY